MLGVAEGVGEVGVGDLEGLAGVDRQVGVAQHSPQGAVEDVEPVVAGLGRGGRFRGGRRC